MRIKSIENLWRRARAAVKNSPEGRALDRKKARFEQSFASGRISKSQLRAMKRGLRVIRSIDVLKEADRLARDCDFKRLFRLRRRRLVNRAAYGLLKA